VDKCGLNFLTSETELAVRIQSTDGSLMPGLYANTGTAVQAQLLAFLRFL
jgi:hypothetical protein